MKYQVNTNEENYVLSIGINGNEELNTIEIEDVSSLDTHINAYKVVDNVLVLDSTRLAEIIAEETSREEAERQEEEHEAKIETQTRSLAEMFISSGENSTDFMDRIDAQTLYTALMTDTLIESEEEV